MRFKIVAILIALLVYEFSLYANRISGTVKDTEGRAIAFALIQVEGTEIVSVADQQGNYVIELEPGTYELLATSPEYHIQSKRIEVVEKELVVNFVLDRETFELEHVVVTAGEDLGVRIMRKVIANRQQQAQKMKSLETEVYLKTVLALRELPNSFMGVKIEATPEELAEAGFDSTRRGERIVYLLEQHTDYYYSYPNRTFNRIKSVRTAGDPRGLGFAEIPAIVNIYENNVKILDGLNPRGFVSPASSHALQYYDFKFRGEVDYKGKIISKIEVIPKLKYGNLFSGFVYVVEDEWVFRAVDLLLTRKSGMDLLDTLKFKQTFEPYGQTDLWVIRSQSMEIYMKLFGFGIGGDVITSYQIKQINQPISDSIFNQKYISIYEDDALEKRQEYWDSIRSVPLREIEQNTYQVLDSIATEQAEKQSLAYNTWRFGAGAMLDFYVAKRGATISLPPLLEMASFTTVEGWSANFIPKLMLTDSLKTNKIDVWLGGRYGFTGNTFYYKGGMGFQKFDKEQAAKNWKVSLDAGSYLFKINNLSGFDGFVSSIFALYGWNFTKYYEADFVHLSGERNFGNGWSLEGKIDFENRRPLENVAEYLVIKKYRHRTSLNNPLELPDFAPHKSFVYDLVLRYQPGWKYYKLPKKIEVVKGHAPVFSMGITQGLKGVLDSRSDFLKWRFGVKGYQFMKSAGYIDYQVLIGGFLKKNFVGNPDYTHYIGNEIWIASPYLNSFQLAPLFAYSNTSPFYTQAHIEWKLAGLLTNMLPVFKHLNWHLVTGANALYVSPDRNYTEVFVGIDNIGYNFFRIGRLDFVWGWGTEHMRSTFGIRWGSSSMMQQFGYTATQ